MASLVALGGCSSSTTRTEPAARLDPAARPADFTLAISVVNPAAYAQPRARRTSASPNVPGAPAPAPKGPAPEVRPARYVIEPDGYLRAALGPGATDRTFPPPSRRLTTAQLDALWALVAQTDWLAQGSDRADQAPPAWTDGTSADPTDPLAPATSGFTGSVLAAGQRANFARTLADRSTRVVTAKLAEWAWQTP